MGKEQFDVIVIGSGPAGGIVARTCRKAGLEVAVVERDGWGGVCPLRGCEPKKVLVDAAHAASRVQDMAPNGLSGQTQINWPELIQFKRSLIDPISGAVHRSFEKSGIKAISGQAAFDDDGNIHVPEYGTLQAKHIVITTGARPRKMGIPGEDLLLTSRDFLNLDAIPRSVIFIGGGFISMEFADVAATANCKTTIIHRSERILRGFDHDLSLTLLQAMADKGVGINLNHPVTRVESTESGICVVTLNESGTVERFTADMAVSAVGRIPNIDTLNLEAVNVEFSTNGIHVNRYMQSTSNPKIYAAGDCVEPGHALTPTASLQAEAVAHNIIDGASVQSDLSGTASVVFTHPPLMQVGLLEEQAHEQGLEFSVHSGNAAKWSEHKRLGLNHAGYKILEERTSGRIIGAHYLGQHAEEVANIFGLAVRHNLTKSELLAQPWAYPSFGYALRYMLS